MQGIWLCSFSIWLYPFLCMDIFIFLSRSFGIFSSFRASLNRPRIHCFTMYPPYLINSVTMFSSSVAFHILVCSITSTSCIFMLSMSSSSSVFPRVWELQPVAIQSLLFSLKVFPQHSFHTFTISPVYFFGFFPYP